MLSHGTPVEKILAHLREAGLSKGQSIWVLATASGKPLQKAKELVHFSKVWADVSARDEELHENILKDLKD